MEKVNGNSCALIYLQLRCFVFLSTGNTKVNYILPDAYKPPPLRQINGGISFNNIRSDLLISDFLLLLFGSDFTTVILSIRYLIESLLFYLTFEIGQ